MWKPSFLHPRKAPADEQTDTGVGSVCQYENTESSTSMVLVSTMHNVVSSTRLSFLPILPADPGRDYLNQPLTAGKSVCLLVII